MRIKAKQVHRGQYRPYVDSYYEWELTTKEDQDNVLRWCFEKLCDVPLPEKSEYMANIRHGTGKRAGDADYYFRGYYDLTATNYGYKFIICKPSTC